MNYELWIMNYELWILRQIVTKLEESAFPSRREGLKRALREYLLLAKISINAHGLLLRLRVANVAMTAVFKRGIILTTLTRNRNPESNSWGTKVPLIVPYLIWSIIVHHFRHFHGNYYNSLRCWGPALYFELPNCGVEQQRILLASCVSTTVCAHEWYHR